MSAISFLKKASWPFVLHGSMLQSWSSGAGKNGWKWPLAITYFSSDVLACANQWYSSKYPHLSLLKRYPKRVLPELKRGAPLGLAAGRLAAHTDVCQELLASSSVDFERGDVNCCWTESWVLWVASTALPPSEVGDFSTFPASTYKLANQVAATPLELGKEIVHGGGTNSKEAAHLWRQQEEMWLIWFAGLLLFFYVVSL